MQILPMVLRKRLICYIGSGVPDNLISLINFGRVDSFFTQRYFVLFIVVYWCHFLNDSKEDRYGITWEALPSMPAKVLVVIGAEIQYTVPCGLGGLCESLRLWRIPPACCWETLRSQAMMRGWPEVTGAMEGGLTVTILHNQNCPVQQDQCRLPHTQLLSISIAYIVPC